MDDWSNRVTIRAIEADDVDRLRRLFFRLSPETIQLRFFQPVRTPSEPMLRHLAGVDHDRRQALAAVVDDEIIGVARYDRSDDTHAETAIVVEDAWQGHGIGHLLLDRLTRDAVEHGIEEFTATVLGENRRMLRLMHQVAPQMHTHLDHGEWFVDMPLKSA